MQKVLRALPGLILIAVLIGGFAALRSLIPAAPLAEGMTAGEILPSPSPNAWQEVIVGELLSAQTPRPTVNLPMPTLPPPTPIGTVLYQQTPTPTRYRPAPPTMAVPTAAFGPSDPEVRRFNDPREGEFSPPPEQVPLSLDPRDHFYFRRPVDASANSSSIFWYVYGSDGPQNAWRVHHGIDLPNPVGKEVRAAAAGRVIWAADNYVWFEEGRRIESAYTYGNVVIIQHDFGFQGKRLYTLYAHLNVILVTAGQRVQSGEIIGLSGRSGVVSGPHVHFEVRVGRNNYYETRNPLLWMAPYANTGVVAGRVVYPNGQFVNDVTVRLVNAAGRTVDTTTTYVNPRVPGLSNWNVNPDEVWNENFVFGDVPPGEYMIVVSVNGIVQRRSVTVRPATTTFVDFGASEIPLEPTPAG